MIRSPRPHSFPSHALGAQALAALRGENPDGSSPQINIDTASLPELVNAGVLAHACGQLAVARQCYDSVLVREPGFTEARYNLAILEYHAGNQECARSLLEELVRDRPLSGDALLALCYTLRRLGETDAAVEAGGRAVTVEPANAEAWNCLGNAWQEAHEPEQALRCYSRAVAMQPGFASAHWNRSLVLLAAGELKEGWAEYEWGLRTPQRRAYRGPLPPWRGELGIARLLVYSDQGVGDAVMFASCLPDLAVRNIVPVVECTERLVPLLSRSFPQAEVVASEHARPEQLQADAQVPLGGLPRLLRPAFSRFPRTRSWLSANPAATRRWRGRLDDVGAGVNVGIAWSGGADPDTRRQRSLPASALLEAVALPGVQVINLQHGEARGELARAARDRGIAVHDWEDRDPLGDLDDFAALLAALDLVVSVDNTSVHLAGALGRPTWVMLPANAEWRWFRDRSDSPWYAGARLFRQPAPGQWSPVLDEIRDALAGWLGEQARAAC